MVNLYSSDYNAFVQAPGDGTKDNPAFGGLGLILDAFGRWRISRATNRFDVEFIYNKQPSLIDEVSEGGGATATHDADSRDVVLDIVDADNGTGIALYGYDVPYTPGNSQLVDITGTLDNAALQSGEAQLFVRTSVSGSLVQTNYDQDNWADTVSDMDWSKSQILVMDFQSLKVGRIRYGFSRGGVAVPVLEVTNDNIRSTGYWQSPSLPPFWRIYNDATYTYAEMGYGDTANAIGLRYRMPVNANATLRAICASVKSEDGVAIENIPSFIRAKSNGNTAITVSDTLVPVFSIRPASTFNSITNRGLYIPLEYSIQGNNPIRHVLLLNPSLTDPDWTAVDATNSGMEYDVSATAVSGGIDIDEDYLATGNNSRSKAGGLLGRTIMRYKRTGVSDILTLAAIKTAAGDSTTYGKFKWGEIR